jgi:hypothetical protein
MTKPEEPPALQPWRREEVLAATHRIEAFVDAAIRETEHLHREMINCRGLRARLDPEKLTGPSGDFKPLFDLRFAAQTLREHLEETLP